MYFGSVSWLIQGQHCWNSRPWWSKVDKRSHQKHGNLLEYLKADHRNTLTFERANILPSRRSSYEWNVHFSVRWIIVISRNGQPYLVTWLQPLRGLLTLFHCVSTRTTALCVWLFVPSDSENSLRLGISCENLMTRYGAKLLRVRWLRS